MDLKFERDRNARLEREGENKRRGRLVYDPSLGVGRKPHRVD